ncbi:tetratricopeptide repeat protein [Candidatus Sumerlaeota bacterium]|nr:tetratricopeptide repeat protein [Candidatus Sumerlaeota bacterium]
MEQHSLHTSLRPRSFFRYLDVFGDMVFLSGIFLVSLAFHPSLYHPYLAPKMLLLGFFCILLFFVLSLVTILRDGKSAFPLFVLLLSGWVISNLVSSFAARFRNYAFRQSAFFIACAVFSFWAFRRARDKRLFILSVGALALASLCGALYGFMQFSGRDFISLEETGVPVAFWGNPNFAAHFLIAVLPLFLAMIIASRARFFFLALSCLVFLQICFLKSRGGFLGFIAGFVFFSSMIRSLFYKEKAQSGLRLVRFTHVVIFIIFIGILVTSMTFLYLDEWRIAREIASVFSFSPESNQYRILSWKASLRLAFDNILLGIGPGHYRLAFPLYAQPEFWKLLGTFSSVLNVRAHNDYLNILCETGLMGLGFFLGILFYLYRRFQNILKNENVKLREKIFVSGLAAGMLSTLTQSLVDFNLYNPASGLVFWISCGFLAGWGSPRNPVKKKNLSLIPGAILLVLSLFSLIFIPHRLAMNFQTEKDLRNADLFFKAAEYEKAGAIALRVLKRNPHDLDAVTFHADSLRNIKGKEEAAIQAYQRWANIEPWFVPIYNRMGESWFRLGKKDEAIACFEKALSINPYSEPDLLNMANMAISERDFAGAVSYFERAASLGGELMKQTEAQYGIALMQIKKYKEAIIHLERGILVQKDKAPYLSQLLGDCYLAIGDHENAAYYHKISRLGKSRGSDSINL